MQRLPSVGYRFLSGKITVDLTAGLDFGYGVSADENGKAAATSGATFSTSQDRKTISILALAFKAEDWYIKIREWYGKHALQYILTSARWFQPIF